MLEMTLQEFRRVQRINVEGVFLTFRAAARHMAERGQGGSLVATASTAAMILVRFATLWFAVLVGFVALSVLRDGQPVTIEVTLAVRPTNP